MRTGVIYVQRFQIHYFPVDSAGEELDSELSADDGGVAVSGAGGETSAGDVIYSGTSTIVTTAVSAGDGGVAGS
jgi:hypothetical protein